MLRKSLLSTVVLAALSVPGAAQEVTSDLVVVDGEDVATSELAIPDGEPKAVTPACSGGVVYDDGSLNSGYALSASGQRAGAVTRFDLPAGTTSLDQLCVCFFRDVGAPSSISLDLAIYNNNGAGGGPGTLIAQQPLSIGSISTSPTFFNFNLTGLSLALPDNVVYIGVLWPSLFGANGIYICGDTSAGLTQRSNYLSANNGTSWGSYASFFPTGTNNPRTFGIRVDPRAPVTAGCTPSSTAMCLNNNRFKVEATFNTATQGTTSATPVKLTDDSGYLWFFNSNNIELVVKVLNACGVNNRYWVFAAGLTNVGVDITVTDTAHPGNTKTYHNPLNLPYPPLQDTNAFATCP